MSRARALLSVRDIATPGDQRELRGPGRRLCARRNLWPTPAASDCGYNNPYHFSRRFSLAYGEPPGTFRRRRQLSDPFAPVREAVLLPVARRLLEAALSG
jgi:AraC-like DNA-binding protein